MTADPTADSKVVMSAAMMAVWMEECSVVMWAASLAVLRAACSAACSAGRKVVEKAVLTVRDLADYSADYWDYLTVA